MEDIIEEEWYETDLKENNNSTQLKIDYNKIPKDTLSAKDDRKLIEILDKIYTSLDKNEKNTQLINKYF